MNKINIIICALNEEFGVERSISSVIKSLKNAGLTQQSNVYLIDNSSEDNTYNIAKNLSEKHNELIVKRIPRASLSVSRNMYKETLPSEYIAYIDADGCVPVNWAKKLFDIISSKKPTIIAGTVLDYDVENNLTWRVFYNHKVMGPYLMGANMAFKRSALESVGGFPVLFYSRGDESGLYSAMRHKDDTISFVFDDELVAYNEFNPSLKDYVGDLYRDSRRHFIIDKLFASKKMQVRKVTYRNLFFAPLVLTLFNPLFFLLFLFSLLIIGLARDSNLIFKQLSQISKFDLRHPFKNITYGLVVILREPIASTGYLHEYYLQFLKRTSRL